MLSPSSSGSISIEIALSQRYDRVWRSMSSPRREKELMQWRRQFQAVGPPQRPRVPDVLVRDRSDIVPCALESQPRQNDVEGDSCISSPKGFAILLISLGSVITKRRRICAGGLNSAARSFERFCTRGASTKSRRERFGSS